MNKQQIVEIIESYYWYSDNGFGEKVVSVEDAPKIAEEILALEDRLEIVDLEGKRSAQWQPGVLEEEIKDNSCKVCGGLNLHPPSYKNIHWQPCTCSQRTGDEPV